MNGYEIVCNMHGLGWYHQTFGEIYKSYIFCIWEKNTITNSIYLLICYLPVITIFHFNYSRTLDQTIKFHQQLKKTKKINQKPVVTFQILMKNVKKII